MTDSGWRKRQIALDVKAENARELGLDYEVHSCSPFCTRPMCVAVRYAIEKVKEPSPIPLITDEEWAALNEIPEA
jgi:hypothetical protein